MSLLARSPDGLDANPCKGETSQEQNDEACPTGKLVASARAGLAPTLG